MLEHRLRDTAYVVLDLSGLHVLDASGIAALRACLEKIRRRGAAVGVGGLAGHRLIALTHELDGTGALVRHSAVAAMQALLADGAWSAAPTAALPPVAQSQRLCSERLSAAPAE